MISNWSMVPLTCRWLIRYTYLIIRPGKQAFDFIDEIGRQTPTIGRAMPKVFEKDGYKFFFYSNEHRPIHIHVRYAGG
jgi:hypothetical protein